jgi:hypothetical protein
VLTDCDAAAVIRSNYKHLAKCQDLSKGLIAPHRLNAGSGGSDPALAPRRFLSACTYQPPVPFQGGEMIGNACAKRTITIDYR